MIRCRVCGKPVGVGLAKGGDYIACASCLSKDSPPELNIPNSAYHERINEQMRETRAQKGSTKRRRWNGF